MRKYDSKHFVNFRGDQIEANEIRFDTDFSSIGPKRELKRSFWEVENSRF